MSPVINKKHKHILGKDRGEVLAELIDEFVGHLNNPQYDEEDWYEEIEIDNLSDADEFRSDISTKLGETFPDEITEALVERILSSIKVDIDVSYSLEENIWSKIWDEKEEAISFKTQHYSN